MNDDLSNWIMRVLHNRPLLNLIKGSKLLYSSELQTQIYNQNVIQFAQISLKVQYHILMNFSRSQFKAILWKNFLISFRTKQFLREIISVIILGTFIIINQNTTPNSFITPFYLSLALIGYSRSVGFVWVQQKQTYQKQMQNIMGISFFGYSIAWLTYFLLNSIYVCAIMLLLFQLGVILPNEDTFVFVEGYGFHHIVFLYILYALSIIGFVLTISAFFNKAKVAAQAMIFAQLIFNFFYFLRFSESFRTNRALIFLTSIFPQVSFNFGICSIAFQDINIPSIQFTYTDSVVSLSIASVFYLAFSFYLEQVLPNSQGTNKHPLFFIRKIFKKKDEKKEGANQLLLSLNDQEQIAYNQDRHGQNQQPMIKLKNLTKKFGQKTAVNHVSMNFYSDQIFCLLGHNGAGKSTTINLMTGLQKPTGGKIELMGLDYRQDIDQIRKNIGLCLQFNVLYEDLTIQEHLKFYALLKGLDTNFIQENIQQIINQCALTNQKGKFVKNLSGGNKRKLSLANSLIGKSKVIFLDEPSSGLDPNSRQGVWNIIKSLRNRERSIILTTHHLEQAQQLSQVIGIMSQGKMVIIGDCNYIKQKFNVGFHVVLSFNQKNKILMNDCRKLVLQNISGSKEDEQTALNTLKFLLPPNHIKNFWNLFQKLQTMCSLSVKMSNLEDAFIKLGQQVQGQQANINDPDLALPESVCSFSFFRQFKAVFFRKFTSTFRSFSAIVSIILPTIFILLGVLMSCVAIEGDSPEEQYIKRYLMSFFMVWAFIFNTSTFCGDLVLERQKRFKYLSHVLGLRKLPYWAANYCFDIMIFTIPLSIFFLTIFIMGQQSKFLTDVAGYLLVLLIFFAFSFIGYSYLFSFMFQKSSTAFRLFPFFNMIFFYIIPSIPMSINEGDNILAQYLCPMISPFIAFFNSFFTKEIMGQSSYKGKGLYFDYGCLIGQAILFPILTLFIQNLRFRLKDRQVIFNQQEENQQGSFYDAQHINPNDEIYIKNLYKKYSNGFMAIRDNSFSVKKGQIFGLLGPNGAGKSTTFNIVTAALSKTSGELKILNNQITNGIMDIFSQFGVCPQYDSIYENLTTQQHLYYVARVKGIEQKDIPNLIKYYYQLLSLTSYIKVKAGNLSGGNKRKLAVSMALLANPKIMFFDEPSSGVDPISRRFLWKSLYLSSRTKDAAMVLTTHTMSQAESLCSRIGILIKGKFVTVASPAELKLKYGKGFRIEIKCQQINENEIISKMKKQFGENLVIDRLPDQSSIVFTVQNEKFSYSKSYKLLQNIMLENGIIQKYEIKQSTLQQVFLFLSQMQPPVQNIGYIQPWQFCCWQCGQNGCNWI